ncbi:hypothetical protein KM043_000362 [Ampulex compressa]|nr:hypothetical protein KM043_000362 [Ampulex compressa]
MPRIPGNAWPCRSERVTNERTPKRNFPFIVLHLRAETVRLDEQWSRQTERYTRKVSTAPAEDPAKSMPLPKFRASVAHAGQLRQPLRRSPRLSSPERERGVEGRRGGREFPGRNRGAAWDGARRKGVSRNGRGIHCKITACTFSSFAALRLPTRPRLPYETFLGAYVARVLLVRFPFSRQLSNCRYPARTVGVPISRPSRSRHPCHHLAFRYSLLLFFFPPPLDSLGLGPAPSESTVESLRGQRAMFIA